MLTVLVLEKLELNLCFLEPFFYCFMIQEHLRNVEKSWNRVAGGHQQGCKRLGPGVPPL